MTRHSKNAGDKHHLTYHEKRKSNLVGEKVRIGTDSQLPFGYCSLSLSPAEDPVVSPSGNIYEREKILEYLLEEKKKIKKLNRIREELELKQKQEAIKELEREESQLVDQFLASSEGIKRNFSLRNEESGIEITSEELERKKKIVDITSKEEKLKQLKSASVWLPSATSDVESQSYSASSTALPASLSSTSSSSTSLALTIPSSSSTSTTTSSSSSSSSSLPPIPQVPLSPISKQPLRLKDLLPLKLEKEYSKTNPLEFKYICPVSKSTITNQQMVLIKPSGVSLTEESYKKLALKSKTCPVTSLPFDPEKDVLYIKRAATGYSSSGKVEFKKQKLTLN